MNASAEIRLDIPELDGRIRGRSSWGCQELRSRVRLRRVSDFRVRFGE